MVMGDAHSRVLLARLAVAGAVCAAGAAGIPNLLLAVHSPAVVPAAIEAGPAVVAAPTEVSPSFDVVRVGPQGNVVLAGRAEPGATVSVSDGDTTLGQAQADQRGEWVLVPGTPLAPDGRELSLSARMAAGPEVKGGATVLLDVPVTATAPGPVMALLVPQAGAPRVLQGPPAVPQARGNARLALDAVDYDDHGAIRFAGAAPPNAPVRVYVDNVPAGDATADALGRWTLTPQNTVAAGVHRLRVDQLTAAGKVLAQVELPFQRTAVPAAELASGRVVVQPGQNLWRLARRAYGTGMRYTVIYLANREQIRDPRLIYPGQAFAVPTASP